MKDVWEHVDDYEKLLPGLEEKSEQLDRLVPLVMEYNNLRDAEWDFEDEHGPRDMWSLEDCEEHDRLLADIIERRKEVQNLLRVITGNPNLVF